MLLHLPSSMGHQTFSSLRFSGLAFMLWSGECAPFQRGEFPLKESASRSFDGECRMSFFPPDFGQCPKSIPYFFSPPTSHLDGRPWIKSLPTFRFSLEPRRDLLSDPYCLPCWMIWMKIFIEQMRMGARVLTCSMERERVSLCTWCVRSSVLFATSRVT